MLRVRRALLVGLVLLPATCWGNLLLAAEVTAIAGRPFGVGRIVLPLDPNTADLVSETNGYFLEEVNGRVFYPAYGHRRVLGVLRDLLGVDPSAGPSTLAVHFLFVGDEPLELTLSTPEPQRLLVEPEYDPRRFRRLQRDWWQQYSAVNRLQERQSDYPPVVEVYLANMLGQRLGLRPPLISRLDRKPSPPKETLQLVLNTEAMQLRAIEAAMRGDVDRGIADQPLPPPVDRAPRDAITPPDDVVIEPIAMHVPEECFYLRFSSFDNYLWFRRFIEQNGGSANRLVTLRGHDTMVNQKAQAQLGLRETALAELFGNRLISDVALIGRDMYLREGAAMGILFEARNELLLNELTNQRRAAVEALQADQATLRDLTIGDRTGSFASTPDNQLRSFYVVDDRYHLVTNSLEVAERFLECGRGRGSLGQSSAFRSARAQFTATPTDTLFAYFSPAFFQGLASPQYQVELRRRLRAVADLEILALARMAADHERLPSDRLEDLIAAGLLPEEFNRRPDGSQAVMTDQQVYDTLRGARGTFVPIPDVALDGITPEEAERLDELAQFQRQRWSNMDPLVVHVQRSPIEGQNRERIEIRAELRPFEREKYGLITSIIGPPAPRRVRQPDANAVTAQIVVQGGLLRPQVGPHQIFFGIRDAEVPITFSDVPIVRLLQVLRSAPAYLGAWPNLGLLDLLPLRHPPEPRAPGMSRLPFGLWRLITPQGFSLVGVHPELLDQTASELTVQPDPGDAQLVVDITDVSTAKIKTWFAALDFQRAFASSIGNTRLLHAIHQQLGVPQDEARSAAERVLDVELICALGGEYGLYEDDHGNTYWGSTHWPNLMDESADQGEFASPLMAWFRGLHAEVALLPDRVSGLATLEVERLDAERPRLPFFNLWRRN
jgi:hypothetical protein